MEEAQAVEAPVEAPTQADAPATSDQGDVEATQEAAPKAENRYQKLASDNKRMRDELSNLQSQMQSLDGAKNLDSWLKKDPKNLRFVMDLMDGKSTQTAPEKDPYEGYAPEVADRFRKYDALIQKQEDNERLSRESEARSLEENKTYLEGVYMKKLKDDGFIQKDGTYDENEVDLLSDAVLSRATRIAKNPYKITEQELQTAYDAIIKGTKALEKRGLSRKVQPTPPPSGTRNGSIPVGKTRMTDEERVLQISREL